MTQFVLRSGGIFGIVLALITSAFIGPAALGLDYSDSEGAIPTPCLRECPHYYLAEVLREDPATPNKPSSPATPIAPNFIITAGHRTTLLEPDPGLPYRRVLIDGEIYYMVDRRPPNGINDYYDVSVFRIEKPDGTDANLTHWVALYDHDDELGKQITIPSFGYQGYIQAPSGLHWGRNVIRTASTILAKSLRVMGNDDYITYEVNGISGDSGAAWLIKDGPEWKISGFYTTGGSGPRLSTHHVWIDNAIAEMGGTRPLPTITYDTTWQGSSPGNWIDPSNWNPALPVATDLVDIDSGPAVIVSAGDTAQANEVVVGKDNSADVSQTGGTVDVGEGIYIGTQAGSTGTYTMTGGALNVGETDFKGRLIVGLHGTGTLNVNSADAQIDVDEFIVGSDGTGTLNINDPGAQINVRYLTFDKAANLNAVPGSTIDIAVDDKCAIYGGQLIILPEANPNNLDLADLTLDCYFKDGTIYDDDLIIRIEAAGADTETPTAGDFIPGNFVLDKLIVGRNPGDINDDAGRVTITIVDNWDNQNDGMRNESVYVNTLEIRAGVAFNIKASTRKSSYNLYYRNGGDPKQLLIGDLNLNGIVACSEAALLISNIGTTSGAGWADGDLDGDRDVDTDDLTLVMDANNMTDCDANGMPDQCETWTTRLHVDIDATGTNTGQDWTNAFTDLQTALCLAENIATVQEIWVAEGTYYPTGTGDIIVSFNLIDNVNIYGGFTGTELTLAERDWDNHPTILSGDINTPGDNTDNSYHVVKSFGVDGHLDGFIITGGHSMGAGKEGNGAGIIISNGDSTIANCKIIDNSAELTGGGIRTEIACQPTIVNCLFSGNSADKGGGIYIPIGGLTVTLINCTFSKNSATDIGGAIGNAPDPSGMIGVPSDTYVNNCILWGNTDVTGSGETSQISDNVSAEVGYSCVQGGWTGVGVGNIDANPLFADPDGLDDAVGTQDDNLQLRNDSPCIDAGDDSQVPPNITTDLKGNNRIIDGDEDLTATVDMGAYEFDPTADDDYDGVLNGDDNCPYTSNANQDDGDTDGWGDACDQCPNDPDNDADADGACDDIDNCLDLPNPDQADTDSDGEGDACDCDDGLDGDGNGQVDADTDGVEDECDNCPDTANPGQIDGDNDGIGDACDHLCDLNHDNNFDINDYDNFMAAFGHSEGEPEFNPEADMFTDGTINVTDYQFWLQCGLSAPGDFNLDGDVDQEDFGHLQECLTGIGIDITDPSCMDADLDGNNYADQDDLNIFELCLSGANVLVHPECAN